MLALQVGTVVGKYKIVRPLGEGGMGTVFEAEHTLTFKRAAIKFLHAGHFPHEQVYERILKEARATSRIRHRNVVDVYDVVVDGDSICLVMELLEGEQLSAFTVPGRILMHEFVALLLPAMRGVSAAHAVGVVHRDIKPENIVLAREAGQPEPIAKVIDFGISKVSDGDVGSTHSGITMGTPKYVSYEQLLGARNVDARADIYSFGVILYEALTCRAPHQASTFGEQAVSFATRVPGRPRELRPDTPEALDAAVYQAIAKDRDQRQATLAEFIAQIEPFAHPSAYPTPLACFSPDSTPYPNGANPRALPTEPREPTPDSVEVSGTARPASSGGSAAPRLNRRSVVLAIVLLVVGSGLWVASLDVFRASDRRVPPLSSPGARAQPFRAPAEPAAGVTAAPDVVSGPLPAKAEPLALEPAEAPALPAASAAKAARQTRRAKAPARVERGVESPASMAPAPLEPSVAASVSEASPDQAAGAPFEAPSAASETVEHRAGKLQREEF